MLADRIGDSLRLLPTLGEGLVNGGFSPIAIQNPLAERGGDDAAVGAEQLQAVVLGRVVAGGDLHSARGAELSDKNAGRGSRRDVSIQAATARSANRLKHPLGDRRPAFAAVAGDDHIPRRRFAQKSGNIANGDLGGQTFPDNPS